jgi:hypothetical protein
VRRLDVGKANPKNQKQRVANLTANRAVVSMMGFSLLKVILSFKKGDLR